jgi:hypothetical protein
MYPIQIFIRFFKRVGNVFVQLLLNESPYMFAMVTKNVGLRNDYKGQMWYS